MRIYIAAPWTCRAQAADAAQMFELSGHTITRRWWTHRDTDEGEELAAQAVEDVDGIWNAQALVVLNVETSEGKAVETGLALAYMMPVIVVGERTNIFHHLPAIHVVPTLTEAVDLLNDL